jgi:hypothetical protein
MHFYMYSYLHKILFALLVAAALCNFLWTHGSFCNKQVFILLNMDSGYHIVTVRVI